MVKYTFIIILFLFSRCGKLPMEVSGKEVRPFIGDFETGKLSGWYPEYVETGYSVRIVNNPVRSGTYAAQFNLRPGDMVNDGNRSEIAVYECAHYGSEVYYGWSFFIDTDYSESGEWQIIGQWHDQPDFLKGETWDFYPKHSPPISLTYINGKLLIVMNTPDNSSVEVASRAIAKGVWHDVVFHVYWSMGPDAYQEAWLDGSYLTPDNGTDHKYYRPNLYNKSGNYFKIGLYRSSDIKTVNTVYFDSVHISHSFEEVLP